MCHHTELLAFSGELDDEIKTEEEPDDAEITAKRVRVPPKLSVKKTEDNTWSYQFPFPVTTPSRPL